MWHRRQTSTSSQISRSDVFGTPSCTSQCTIVCFEPDVSAIEGVLRGLRCKKQQLISRATSRGWRRRRTSKCTQAEYARRVISASRSRVRRRSKPGKEKARRRARRSRGEGSRPPGHRDPCLHAIKFGWYFNVSSQGPAADIIRGHALNGFPCSIVSMS